MTNKEQALDRVRQLRASYTRNVELLVRALRKAGLPSSWLGGWDRKLQKIEELIEGIEGN